MENTYARILITIHFVFAFLFSSNNIHAQITVVSQGFDGSGNWSYVGSHTNGAHEIDNSKSYLTPSCLKLDNHWNDNLAITFDAIDISAYTGVQFSIAYESIGEADNGDDLFIDSYYYDAGSWNLISTKIADGGTAPNTVAFGTSSNTGESNPFLVSIPDSATNFYVIVRGAYNNDSGGDHDSYYIDDAILTATPPLDPIPVDDALAVQINSSGSENQIDVSLNDVIGSDGSDGEDYTLNIMPTNGIVTEISDGVFEYIPTTNYLGLDSFTYNICDSNGDCDIATVNVTVNYGQCIPTMSSNGSHWITNFNAIGETTLNNTSGDNGGYADFSGIAPDLKLYKGSAYDFTLSVNNGGGSMGWSLYIDLNGDADFDDTGEMLYDTDGTEAIPFATQSITIPTSTITGKTILRVGTMLYYSANVPCGGNNSGEFEDYVVDLQIDTNTPREIDITGNSNAIANGSTTISSNINTDYTIWDIFAEPLTQTYTIYNNGGLDLTLSGAVTISPSTDFSISTQPSDTTLSISESTTFSVSFNPSSVGLKQATVTVRSDDANEDPYTFLVQGYGDQTFPDTDYDGIPDNVDIDDDNDGLLDITEQVSCISSTVSTTTDVIYLNEDFQSGTFRGEITGASYCYEDGTGSCNGNNNLSDGEYVVYYKAANGDTTNDTPNGEVASWADEYWYPGFDHTPDDDGDGDDDDDDKGRMAIFNAADTPGVFYETTIFGVSSGVDITYGFSALNLDRADAPDIATRERPSVLIEVLDPLGVIIASSSSGEIQPTTDYVNGDWVEVSATFNTTYTQFTVKLSNENLGGIGNDLAIDDIFVLQTLCDLDGDGVEDSVDLDNDDDGIPNVIELQLTDDDKDGTVNNDSGAYVWVDINNNGMLDLYDPQDSAGLNSGDVGFTVSVGTKIIDLSDPIYDTDGDGVLDYLDLDSDNDGIFDTVEYDNRGDVDINGDGDGDGSDSDSGEDDDDADGDGILGPADSNDDDVDGIDHGTGNSYPTPIDDDGDGIPNFRDIDSDDSPNDLSNGSDIDKLEIYAHLDANNDGLLDDTIDTDNDGILDIFDTDNTVFGSPRDLDGSYTLFFDGRNDYIAETSVIDGWLDVTVMAWVKVETSSTGKRVVLGQNEIQLLITTTGTVNAVANGTTISSSVIDEGIWVHIAAVYNGTGSMFTLYINGEQVDSAPISGALPADTSNFTLGRTPDTDSDYFEGQIDEVRVFNKSLTEEELQRMVYQELTSAERGAIIPVDISGALAGTLVRYYKMDVFDHDITTNGGSGATLYNIKDIYFQTAPLPYETITDGNWGLQANWLHGDVWDIHDEINNKDWSIVNIKNNINTSSRHSTLGLFIDSSVKLEVNDDSELQNTWYLSLDGKIDLQGESQLIQTQNSTLVGSGILERDQQGTENLYTYNYWSSPVHTANPNAAIDGDETYTVASVLMDGEDPDIPAPITFLGGSNYDGDNTSNPIEIADYWIWKYSNLLSDTYALWQHVRSTGELLVGEGYTMKGPGTGSISTDKNYTFTGTPNNGEINLYTHGGNGYLVGNPYPSAIDGAEFLGDNPHLDGTLYFWEHYGGGSHILLEYQGGYGLYNYSGGTPALDGSKATPDSDVSQIGSGSKTPKRYIPVGQGFFVEADGNGDVKFENDQRVFITEAGSTNSVFLKNENTKKSKSTKFEDVRPKIRISYKSPKGYKRQLLVTADENASMNYDWGYDGILMEENLDDMYWKIEDKNYIIQGINNIDPVNTILPIGVRNQEDGIAEIAIDNLENVPDDIEIYLKDKDNNLYQNLRASKYIVNVTKGDVDDRFEIVFSNQNQLSKTEIELNKQTSLFYEVASQNLVIVNPNNYQIDTVQLINMLGQVVLTTKVEKSDNLIEIFTNLKTGIYIAKIISLDFEISKKLIINN